MLAVVPLLDTAPLPASSVNSPANRLVPAFSASASPLESADPKSLASAHSKRLTENLSPAESAVTETGGILPPPIVTPLEPSPSPASSICRRINSLRTLCTNQLIKNCRISRSFIRLRTLAKTMGGWHYLFDAKTPAGSQRYKMGRTKVRPCTERTYRKNVQKERTERTYRKKKRRRAAALQKQKGHLGRWPLQKGQIAG